MCCFVLVIILLSSSDLHKINAQVYQAFIGDVAISSLWYFISEWTASDPSKSIVIPFTECGERSP